MSQLNKKEKAFCRKYLETGNINVAAKLSGISKDPYELLGRDEINAEINRLGERINRSAEYIAKSALIRLAVGNVSDAVNLIYSDEESKNLPEGADLFMVSEIKRRGDTTEIKFFDRFKAIKSLLDGFDNVEEAVPFYDALIEGAKKLNGKDGD
ncbi:MAG: terminase small subunit [Ruminococcus sp.]|jgi:hypothetical protein|nr:terminase small subunit [Ruminococcus sp.]